MEGTACVSRVRFTPRQKAELWERWLVISRQLNDSVRL